MAKIDNINPLSFATFQAVLFALLGLLAGVIYSFGGLAIDSLVTLGWMTTTETPGLSYGTVLAFGALIGMPLIGLMAGLITGFIEAILFNIVAKWFGGIKIDFKK
jgi:hypothetical protein